MIGLRLMDLKRVLAAAFLTGALVLSLTLGAAAAAGGSDLAGTAAVMDIGIGARALGMGGAFVGVADDAASVYYNPAGLGIQSDRSVTSFYTNQLKAANYGSVAYAQKNFGGAALLAQSSGIQGTDEFGNPTEFISYSSMAFLGSYGVRVLPMLSVGATAKYFSEKFPAYSGTGFTADIGILADFQVVRVGVAARNLFGAVNYGNGTSDPFDRKFVAGLSGRPIKDLLLAADVESDMTIRAGAEYAIGPLAVRGGLWRQESVTAATAGLGVHYGAFRFDYALQWHPELRDSHRLSLGITF